MMAGNFWGHNQAINIKAANAIYMNAFLAIFSPKSYHILEPEAYYPEPVLRIRGSSFIDKRRAPNISVCDQSTQLFIEFPRRSVIISTVHYFESGVFGAEKYNQVKWGIQAAPYKALPRLERPNLLLAKGLDQVRN